MSKPVRTSKEIQAEFNDLLFKLGQESRNEERAMDNQIVIQSKLAKLETEFTSVKQKEDEFARQQAKADAATKAFEDKAKANSEEPAPVTP